MQLGDNHEVGFALHLNNGRYLQVWSTQYQAMLKSGLTSITTDDIEHLASLQTLGDQEYGTSVDDYRVPLACLQTIASTLDFS